MLFGLEIGEMVGEGGGISIKLKLRPELWKVGQQPKLQYPEETIWVICEIGLNKVMEHSDQEGPDYGV